MEKAGLNPPFNKYGERWQKNGGQVLPSGLFVGFKWPFQELSDLYLGDQKATRKKLGICSYLFSILVELLMTPNWLTQQGG